MKKLRLALYSLLAVSTLPMMAQNEGGLQIGFEKQDYKRIGVYDTWERSPFRSVDGASPLLQGNVRIVENIDTLYDAVLKSYPDTSRMVLAMQRSRFGSNTFGVRVDLSQTFELTPKTRYVHVLIHKPKAGRSMLIGLGKRKDRPGQSEETEQFWTFSSNEVTTGKWVDAVFPVKGAGNIDIHSLVIVPDCEDTNGLTDDFIAYIDNIELNDSPLTSTNRDDYPMNYDKKQTYTRSDRGLKGVSMGSQSVTAYNDITTSTPVYTHLDKKEFIAKAGDTLSVAVNYKGSWMNSYVYVDFNNDGRFTPQVKGGKIVPNAGNELCTYSFLAASDNDESTGFNSDGKTIAKGSRNTLTMPKFVLPDTLRTGFYRMRYKVDWNCADPGGNVTEANNILHNGGGVIDIRLNIHEDTVTINHSALNGEVVSSDGKKLNRLKIPFGKPFKVKMQPADGFEFTGLSVRHGYNLAGDSLSHGTRQYVDEFIPRDAFAADSTVIIPAEMIDGDVSLEGKFVDARNTVVYEVYFGDKKTATKTVYGAQTGKVVVPENLKRDFCTYESMETEVTQLPATIRINAVWNGPVTLTGTAADTVWYQLKVSNKDKWVIYKNANPNVLFSSAKNNVDGLWAFGGNPYDGIVIFNRSAPSMVLASASPRNSGNTGANTHATLKNVNDVSEDETFHWTLSKSEYADGSGFYICNPEGFALNYRSDNNLAYWTNGKDGGSTFVPTLYTNPTGIGKVLTNASTAAAHIYDMSGRAVGKDYKGLVIKKGKKYMAK